MSTVSRRALLAAIAAACAAKGVEMLDAPVSGGEPGAINATLAIMVGGKQEVFDQNFDLLKTMGGNVVLTGDIGAGGVTKLANQIIVAVNIVALSEALVLAQKAGVDPERVFNAIRGGLAGSAVMEAKGPMMLSRNFRAGFRGEGFDVFGWVRNALDVDYIETLQVAPGNTGLIAGQPGDPRTWGGTIKFSF